MCVVKSLIFQSYVVAWICLNVTCLIDCLNSCFHFQVVDQSVEITPNKIKVISSNLFLLYGHVKKKKKKNHDSLYPKTGRDTQRSK